MIKESKVPGVEKDNKNEELKKEMEQERDKSRIYLGDLNLED